MLAMAWVLATHTILGAAGLVAILLVLVVVVNPELAFMASIVTIIFGQLIRVPIGGGDASIIPNDIILPLLIVCWIWRKMLSGTWKWPRHSLTAPLVAVIATMILSLLFNFGQYENHEFLSGSLYFVRWLEYLALWWVALDMVRSQARAQRYVKILVWSGVILAGLGFFQLKLFPDFSFMVPKGWDPHVGRLLSTWFDPNFLSGYFVVLVSITLATALYKGWKEGRWWWAATLVMVLAIVLTYSRSGYVGLTIAFGIVTAFRSRAILYVSVLAFLATALLVPRVQERVIGIRTIDETAQLRLVSYRNAATVISDHPWVGVGYNMYKYIQVRYGFLRDTQEHSASGSDSSLLTVWVTTGFIGLAAYLWLLIALLREAWRTWRDRSLPNEWRGYGLGLFAGLLGLFAHSQFVNGLQYPHIMEIVWILIAIAIMVRQPEPA